MIGAVGLGTIFITYPVLQVPGAVSCSAWTLFGSAFRPILTSPGAVRAFNVSMAALLLASPYPVFMDA